MNSLTSKHRGLARLEKSARAILGNARAYSCIVLVAIAIFGFAWWFHSHISKERIATLQDRLRLGKQVQEHITNQLDSLKLS
jgi:hypothetical protein